MKKVRAISAFILALTAVISATGCSNGKESSNPYADVDVSADVRKKIKESVMTTDLLPDTELEIQFNTCNTPLPYAFTKMF